MNDPDPILEDLQTELAEGDVVAVVGAGLSLLATNGAPVASWGGLLKDGVLRCQQVAHVDQEWVARATADIDSGEMDGLLATATKITNKLGGINGPEFGRWLEETVGKLEPVSPAVLEALKDLPIPILTTNYDLLLEKITGRDPVTWKETARVQRALRKRDQAIVHLHGHWRVPESVVLGIPSYEAVKGSNVQAILQALAGMKCLLLIGFGAGLQDPNFGALRQWMAVTYAQSPFRHFRLYCESEREQVRGVHGPGERVSLISYGIDHSDLIQFLRQLGRTTRVAALTSEPPREVWPAQQPAWQTAVEGVTQHASVIAKAQLTLLNMVKGDIGQELYNEQRREVLTNSLQFVRERLEGRL